MSLNSEEKNTAYEKLTPQRKQLVDKVMENLEKGNLFWTQGWLSSGAPESAITGKKYRGINNLFLSLIAMSENYGDNRWATFKQMEEKGWTFKKDEEGKSAAKGKGATVEYYEMRDKETKKRFDTTIIRKKKCSQLQKCNRLFSYQKIGSRKEMYFKNEKHRQAFEAGIKKANKKDRETELHPKKCTDKKRLNRKELRFLPVF